MRLLAGARCALLLIPTLGWGMNVQVQNQNYQKYVDPTAIEAIDTEFFEAVKAPTLKPLEDFLINCESTVGSSRNFGRLQSYYFWWLTFKNNNFDPIFPYSTQGADYFVPALIIEADTNNPIEGDNRMRLELVCNYLSKNHINPEACYYWYRYAVYYRNFAAVQYLDQLNRSILENNAFSYDITKMSHVDTIAQEDNKEYLMDCARLWDGLVEGDLAGVRALVGRRFVNLNQLMPLKKCLVPIDPSDQCTMCFPICAAKPEVSGDRVARRIPTIETSRFIPLLTAAESGHVHIVRYLIEDCKVNINITDGYYTALDSAVLGGHTPVVEYLLQQGADPFLCPAYGGGKNILQQLDHWLSSEYDQAMLYPKQKQEFPRIRELIAQAIRRNASQSSMANTSLSTSAEQPPITARFSTASTSSVVSAATGTEQSSAGTFSGARMSATPSVNTDVGQSTGTIAQTSVPVGTKTNHNHSTTQPKDQQSGDSLSSVNSSTPTTHSNIPPLENFKQQPVIESDQSSQQPQGTFISKKPMIATVCGILCLVGVKKAYDWYYNTTSNSAEEAECEG